MTVRRRRPPWAGPIYPAPWVLREVARLDGLPAARAASMLGVTTATVVRARDRLAAGRRRVMTGTGSAEKRRGSDAA